MVCDGTEDAARPELNLQGAIPQGAESHTAPVLIGQNRKAIQCVRLRGFYFASRRHGMRIDSNHRDTR